MATKAETTQTTITNATPIKATTTETAIVLSDEFLEKVAGGEYDPSQDPSGCCLTPDTLIALADGSAKRVDELADDDILLVWDFDAGDLTSAPITFFHRVHQEAAVLRVSFSDGTSVGVVDEHVFFDLTDRKYVAINSADQESELAGHAFAKLVDGRIEEVTLTSIRPDGTTESYYSPVSEAHFNCFAEGMLSMSGFLKGFYNVFDLEEGTLRYDAAKKAAEIAEIGEIPYAVLASCGSKELFDRNNFGWFSVSLAKGLTTLPEAMRMLDFFRPYFVGEGTGSAAA
ncbi:MAG: hypothetical protein IKF78_08435 [Atopobiaceae bacterium]|nr:hypothetical protein [Atopobiaceae bacterium]